MTLWEGLVPWNYNQRAYFYSNVLKAEEDVSLQSLKIL